MTVRRNDMSYVVAAAIALFLAGFASGLMAQRRDRGFNQPGAAGNRTVDPGVNQPGAAGNVRR